MASTVTIDLRHVARGLEFPIRQVQAVVELLDEGNTVPFITRYRKDQTGGLDEEQIREIQDRLAKMRLLADRKQTILRSIDAQGKLTEKLAKQILSAGTTKRLEDLYLPFKPKKQTLATLARSRGLEELAAEILEAAPACTDLDARARDFANPDRQVPTGADALLGAGHILAEQFSESAELRQRLREILQRTGKIISTQIGGEAPAEIEGAKARGGEGATEKATERVGSSLPTLDSASVAEAVDQPAAASSVEGNDSDAAKSQVAEVTAQATDADPPTTDSQVVAQSETAAEQTSEPQGASAEPVSDAPPSEPISDPAAPSDVAAAPAEPPAAASEATQEPQPPASESAKPQAAAPLATAAARRAKERERAKAAKQNKKELKKKKAEERRIKAFRDYFSYTEEIKKIPPHRVLAINRGERAKVLRVKVEVDLEAMHAALDEMLVPPGHPHADYLRGCARDSLSRLILPAMEREARRELTDRAETHAVVVFAKNLRNLLLQPPIHNRRVLAVDPGFKSGCKLAALDQFGNFLGHEVIFLVGKPGRKDEAKQKSLELIRKFELTVVAVGNGTACRESEDFFAELLETELKGQGVAYVIVNEAGASVYSTSQTGREEFPDYDATLRGAISIGRRLLDPLSELVKIEPANIGVGLYQHDLKAKHLQTSLDDVVESCVNYVAVDVNTASPALLRYVSGLNQLTARRVYEHRREHGPFRNREQLRAVPGFGEATFVQAAGFLKIIGGDNPLDTSWIHPESYPVATKILEKFGSKPADLTDKDAAAALAQRVATIDLEATAKELNVGTLTLKDILAQLARPGRDPREDLPAPVFKEGVLKLEDLTPGMELTGTVLNVVDFGCFVDIGMHDSGLVHVSRMADRFIRDPHEVVAVGDIVKVWVMEVDKERRRVSLTMVQPGSQRPRRPTRDEAPKAGGEQRAAGGDAAHDRPPRPGARPGGRGQQRGRGPGGDRRPRPEGQQEQGRGGPGPQAGAPPRREDRRPRRGGPPGSGQRPQGQGYRPPPKPKPIIPITDDMKKGKEPMRTFGDLMQFFEAKKEPPPEAKKPPVEEPPAQDSHPPAAIEPAAATPAPEPEKAQAEEAPPPKPDEPQSEEA